MIETPQSAIRPEKELARLTLETQSAKERFRRRSTLMSDRPSLGHIDSQPILGPLPQSAALVNGAYDGTVLQSPMKVEPAAVNLDKIFESGNEAQPAIDGIEPDTTSDKDNSSEATLVSRPGSISPPVIDSQTVEEQQAILDNKENLSPTKETPSAHVDEHEMLPLRPASPSKVNAQAGALSNPEKSSDETIAPIVYAPPSGKPPPVPPRKPVEPTTDILEEYARQQDVTEVIAHCLFQFSCAMRPTGVDKSGEQLDEIHDLFFGQNISHVTGGKDGPTTVQFFNIITRVANEPNDVYAALDTEYDLSVRDNGTSAFLSITKLPPVFSIALDRVVWDAQAKRPTKLNHHVHIPETIFLDRYLESADGSDLMERRLQTWQLKRELNAITERRKVLETKQANTENLPQLYDQAKMALEHLQSLPDDPRWGPSLGIPLELINKFAVIADDLRSELDAIISRVDQLEQQIKEAFVDMRKHPYRLHAAFFHRGSAGGGHYWVYLYDHKKEVWRSYNDDRVNVIGNLNEIFGKPPEANSYGYTTPSNPYFLVYVKEDLVGRLVESVKREIVYPPPPVAPPSFSGFGASVPTTVARSQVSEMPPRGQDVEMIEYASVDANGTLTPDNAPQPWDDSQLMMSPRAGW
jgi:ubiquitin carboxyl-terminal hydrolase 25